MVRNVGMLGFGHSARGTAAPSPKFEVADESALPKILEKEGRVLLYGSMPEAYGLVGRLIGGSDMLIALVNCEELQEGHRQIAVNGQLGGGSYENVERLGFLPDLIVARCGSLREASGLLEWGVLGSRIICIVEPKEQEHKSWGVIREFKSQLFCGADGSIVASSISI